MPINKETKNNPKTVIWYQVFLSNTNNFQTDLIHRWVTNIEDLGVIAIKRYSTLPSFPGPKPHHQMKFSVMF